MFKTRKGLLLILILIWAGWFPFADDIKGMFTSKQHPQAGHKITLSTQAQKHILYGDERGGGHKHGIGRPCKSEFPEDWNNAKILNTVKMMAANDNTSWKEQNNGYYTSEQERDDVRVRVVLNRDKDAVITAYPVNVKRNPCPAAANDNNPQ